MENAVIEQRLTATRYEFGEVPLNEMHLSVLGKAEGYYHSEAKISLV